MSHTLFDPLLSSHTISFVSAVVMQCCWEVSCNPPDSLLLTCITSPDAAGKQGPWANNPLNYWTQKNWKYIKCVINYSPSSMHYWLSKMKYLLGLCFPYLSGKEQQKWTISFNDPHSNGGCLFVVWPTMFMPQFPSICTHLFQAGMMATPHWLRLFWGRSNALNGLSLPSSVCIFPSWF